MKLQLFALLLVVAGACAMPQANDVVVVESSNEPKPRIIVENQIRRIIQEISNGIKNAGLDPLIIENEVFEAKPLPLLIEFSLLVENLSFVGVSNIRIHSLDYSILLNRLRFDISLPEIKLEVGNSLLEGQILEDKIVGQFKGSFIIQSIRLSGEVRVNVGIIGGISLRSVSLDFSLGGINSDLSLVIQERDHSDFLNNVFNQVIPNALEANRNQINRRLENLVKDIFELLS